MVSLLCGSRKEPSISSLAKSRKFDEIIEQLQTKDSEELYRWLGIAPNDKSNDGIYEEDTIVCSLALHDVILQRPPASVVQLLIQTMKRLKPGHYPEAAIDENSQTALHVAVEVGCDMDVIQCLTETTDLPALTMDAAGRFPLHICCAAGARRGRGAWSNTVHTINHLLEIYPQAVVVPDLSGQTPLQLVQRRGTHVADRRILLTLKMVSHLLSKTPEETPSEAKTAASTTEEEDNDVRFIMKYITSTCALDDDDLSSVGSRGVSRGRTPTEGGVDHCEV